MEDIIKKITDKCQELCVEYLKEEEMCAHFCRFVDHLKEHHSKSLQQLYEMNNKNFQPFEWAMTEVIRWRLDTKNDDEHEIAQTYLHKAKYWTAYQKRHEEL